MRTWGQWAGLVLAIILVPVFCFGDAVHLKNGTTVFGTISEITDSTVTIVIDGRSTATYWLADVLYIERSGGTPQQGSYPSGQQPVVVVQQQQQQQPGYASSLTLEQEWNNAVYYAKQREAGACGFFWATLAMGTLGALLVGLSQNCGTSEECYTVFSVLAGVPLVVGLATLVIGPIRCANARAETQRLEAIGRQRGWVYLGRLIAPPTINAHVIVQKQDSVLDWIKFFMEVTQ